MGKVKQESMSRAENFIDEVVKKQQSGEYSTTKAIEELKNNIDVSCSYLDDDFQIMVEHLMEHEFNNIDEEDKFKDVDMFINEDEIIH